VLSFHILTVTQNGSRPSSYLEIRGKTEIHLEKHIEFRCIIFSFHISEAFVCACEVVLYHSCWYVCVWPQAVCSAVMGTVFETETVLTG